MVNSPGTFRCAKSTLAPLRNKAQARRNEMFHGRSTDKHESKLSCVPMDVNAESQNDKHVFVCSTRTIGFAKKIISLMIHQYS
jgi:hypothetical protein